AGGGVDRAAAPGGCGVGRGFAFRGVVAHRRYPRVCPLSSRGGADLDPRFAGRARRRQTAEGRLMQDGAQQRAGVTVSFTLNDRKVEARAAPFASLADTLRVELGLTG